MEKQRGFKRSPHIVEELNDNAKLEQYRRRNPSYLRELWQEELDGQYAGGNIPGIICAAEALFEIDSTFDDSTAA